MDSKQVLQQLVQKKLKTPLGKGAIEYKTEEVSGGFKSTVVVTADGGKKFVGTVAKEKKVAEASAAKKGADAYTKEVGAAKQKTPEPKAKAKDKANGKSQPKAQPKSKEKATTNGKASEPKESEPYKQMLPILLQKKLKTPLTKGAIEYTYAEATGGYKCTVTLSCDGGKKFVGQVMKDKGPAASNVAKKAVDVYTKEVGEVTVAKKRKGGATSVPQSKKKRRDAEPSFAKLNGLVPKITRKAVTKGDFETTVAEVTGGSGTQYQTTIKVTTLPGYEDTEFTGAPANGKKESKNNAAEEACKMIENDSGIQQMITSALEEKKAKEKERPRPSLLKFKAKLEEIKAERAAKK